MTWSVVQAGDGGYTTPLYAFQKGVQIHVSLPAEAMLFQMRLFRRYAPGHLKVRSLRDVAKCGNVLRGREYEYKTKGRREDLETVPRTYLSLSGTWLYVFLRVLCVCGDIRDKNNTKR